MSFWNNIITEFYSYMTPAIKWIFSNILHLLFLLVNPKIFGTPLVYVP